jgi:hypothetical protein
MFDAQYDLYGVKDNPDRLLLYSPRIFAVRVSALPASCSSTAGPVNPTTARYGPWCSTREVIPVAHDPDLAAAGCGLDCRKLASIAKMIEAAIQEGADLVVINRFGKLEATGEGPIELIQRAADADIPALIAVPQHRFAGWITMSAGALDRWWESVAMGLSDRSTVTTLCALAK